MAPTSSTYNLIEVASLSKRDLTKGAKIGIGVGVGVGVLLLLALIGFIVLCTVLAKKRKAKKANTKLHNTSPQSQTAPLHNSGHHPDNNNNSYDYPETQQTQNYSHSPQVSQPQHGPGGGGGGRMMQGSNHQAAAPAVTQYTR